MTTARKLLCALCLFSTSTLLLATDPRAAPEKLAASEQQGRLGKARERRTADISPTRISADDGPSEYQRNRNVPGMTPGTRVSRQAERQAQRAEVRRMAAAGELPSSGDEWMRNLNQQHEPSATRQERRAQRREVDAQVRAANKRGEIPLTTEAGVGVSR